MIAGWRHLVVVGVSGALLICPARARSNLLVVPDEYPTIQAAIGAASPGDSILIRAGVHAGNLTLAGKDLVLFGESGAGSTSIDGGDTVRVLDVGAGVTAATVLSDLSLLHGRAARGGAIRIDGGSSITIRRCRFASNQAIDPDSSSFGGAMVVGPASGAWIEDCVFEDNAALVTSITSGYGSGGAIAVLPGGSLTLRGSRFDSNFTGGFEGGSGGAISTEASSGSIEACEFVSNSAAFGGAITADGDMVLRDCTFASNYAPHGASAVQCGATASADASGPASPLFRVEGNVFHDNQTAFGGTLGVYGSCEATGNTVAFNRGSFGSAGIEILGGGVQVRNNIVARNAGIGMDCSSAPPAGAVACNDVWGNTPDYAGACSGLGSGAGNFSVDPVFCDTTARVLYIAAGSPCNPGPGACGRVGVRGPGCALDAVEGATPGERSAVLLAPWPNPSRGRVTFAFVLVRPGRVRLEAYDPGGRRVAVLADGWFARGRHERTWSADAGGARRLPPAAYAVILSVDGERQSRRLIVVR